MVHDWLVSVDAPQGRLLVSLAVVLGLAVGWFLLWWLRDHVGDGLLARSVTVGILAGYLALTTGAVLTVVAVWNVEDPARRLLTSESGQVTLRRVGESVVVLAGAYILVGVSRLVVDRFVESRLSLSTHGGEVLARAAQVGIYGAALLALLAVWDVNLTNVLISAGVLGVVLGLAAQQTLGAVISGFVIMLSRPFEVGDFVRIGDREGTVTEITVVNTRLRTLDHENVSIPNDVVGGSEVVNYSRSDYLRVHVPVGVDYDADLEAAVDAAMDALDSVELVCEQPAPDHDLAFGDSAVEVDLQFFIEDPSAERRWHARRDAVAAVKRAFEEAGIRVPYPQRELSTREDGTDLEVRSEPVEVEDGSGG